MGKITTVFPIVKSICLGYADFLFLRYTYNIDKGKFLKLLLFLFILNFILLKLKSRFKIQDSIANRQEIGMLQFHAR